MKGTREQKTNERGSRGSSGMGKEVETATVSSSDDEGSQRQVQAYVTEFRREVEAKFLRSAVNNSYRFPRKRSPRRESIDSLRDVTFYDLESQNVKHQLLNPAEPPRSESVALVEIVKKLGSLDERYLLSQFRSTDSAFFRVLRDTVEKKIRQAEPELQFSIRHNARSLSARPNNSKPRLASAGLQIPVMNQNQSFNFSSTRISSTAGFYHPKLKNSGAARVSPAETSFASPTPKPKTPQAPSKTKQGLMKLVKAKDWSPEGVLISNRMSISREKENNYATKERPTFVKPTPHPASRKLVADKFQRKEIISKYFNQR